MLLLHNALNCDHARDDVIDHKPLARNVLPRLFDRRLAVEFVVLISVSLETQPTDDIISYLLD